jgi:hypothetical protein
MEGIWITISFLFVFGTIAVVTFGFVRMFGGWHRHGDECALEVRPAAT